MAGRQASEAPDKLMCFMRVYGVCGQNAGVSPLRPFGPSVEMTLPG
jgi:hypothetical protein